MEVLCGRAEDLPAWMALVRRVAYNFPGLETEEALQEHARTVARFLSEGRGLCAMDAEGLAGVLLFSLHHRMNCFLAVAPERRRQGVGSALLREALSRLGTGGPITVTTFRAEDPWGAAPRALYQRFGFMPEELVEENGYPCQRFVRAAESLN